MLIVSPYNMPVYVSDISARFTSAGYHVEVEGEITLTPEVAKLSANAKFTSLQGFEAVGLTKHKSTVLLVKPLDNAGSLDKVFPQSLAEAVKFMGPSSLYPHAGEDLFRAIVPLVEVD